MRPSPRPRRWAITLLSRAGCTTCSSACRCTPAKGRRSSWRSTWPRSAPGYDAMIRTKHEDLQVEIAISDGDMARAQAGLDSWVRRVGEVTPSEAQWPVLNQVSIWLEEGRTEEAAALAARAVDLTSSDHPWELAVAVHLAERAGHRDASRAAAPSFGRCGDGQALLPERRVDGAASRCGPSCRCRASCGARRARPDAGARA